MRRIIVLLLFLFVTTLSFGQEQDMTTYKKHIVKAEKLYHNGHFLKSAKTYSDAFESLGWKAHYLDRYNAACSWSLANVKDSAYFHLNNLAIKLHYNDLPHLLADKDFTNLHGDPQWDELVELVKKNRSEVIARYAPVQKVVDSILVEEKKSKKELEGIANQFGWESQQVKEHYVLTQVNDSINQIRLERVRKECGF